MPLEKTPAPERGFWIGMGWAVLIMAGMVLVTVTVIRLW
jgi:hypothetical protein